MPRMLRDHGRIVILNGAPRAGKSSIAAAIRQSIPGQWVTLGVDLQSEHVIPADLRPGIGLRPGGERPDLEPTVERLFRALYRSIHAYAQEGFDVVADVGHHDEYATIAGILPKCARLLAGLDVLFVGVFAPLETILARRAIDQPGREGQYLKADDGEIPAAILRWQDGVHAHGIYDLTLDTETLTPSDCAARIARALAEHSRPTAFERLAAVRVGSDQLL